MPSIDSRPAFIDATFFLGMHDNDHDRRISSLGLFTQRAPTGLIISLEQVGFCDDVIWCHSRREQDAYYPFMDNLHTLLPIRRLGYCRADLSRAMRDQRLRHLPSLQACALAQVINHNGQLYTHDPLLRDDAGLRAWIAPASQGPPLTFVSPLDALYRDSLCLTLTLTDGRYV